MKRKTIESRRAKIGNYAIRKAEQLRGIFRKTSPFTYSEGSEGMNFEEFKRLKKGKNSRQR